MSFEREVHSSPEAAAAACALYILDSLAGRTATLALSGGTTPRMMFAEMARRPFDWTRLHIFWVDERAVPPGDEQSNYRLAREHLLEPAGVPAANVHRIETELPPFEAAKRYQAVIREFFALSEGELPRFDMIHRGIGADAHTASLFPGEPLIHDEAGIAAAVYVEKFKQFRVTLLPGVLRAARQTAMLVCGADKAAPMAAITGPTRDPLRWPAQVVTGTGAPERWFIDEAAAGL